MTAEAFKHLPCEKCCYGILDAVSSDYPPVTGRLLTCYAPFRRSPPGIATRDAPRLACVKPAASVHPEPGSNSSLYIFYLLSFTPGCLSFHKESTLYCSWYLLLVLSSLFNDLFCSPLLKRDCKGKHLFRSCKLFLNFFLDHFRPQKALKRCNLPCSWEVTIREKICGQITSFRRQAWQEPVLSPGCPQYRIPWSGTCRRQKLHSPALRGQPWSDR